MQPLVFLSTGKGEDSPLKFARFLAERYRTTLEIVPYGGNLERTLKDLNPLAVVVPRGKLPPLVHIFSKTRGEKIAEELKGFNVFLVPEGFERVSKCAVLATLEGELSEDYLEGLKKLVKPLGCEVLLLTVLDEEDELFSLLEKELPETELEDYAEHLVGKTLKKISEIFEPEGKVSTEVLKGEVGTVVPLYAEKEGIDLVVFPRGSKHSEELIENTTVPLLAIGKNEGEGQ